MIRVRTAVSAAAIFAVLGVSAGAMAQDGADDDDRSADVIIVTGEKIERSLQETVSSVSVYDQEVIDSQNFFDVFDLINQTANVSSAFDDSSFTIRGVRNAGVSPGDQTSDVSTVYIDGVFIPSSLFTSSPLNLWDIQSVEIFRGPQSTLQGRNALAGAIIARSVDPGSEFSGDAQFQYGSFDTIRGSAAVSVPLIEDQASLRLSGDFTGTTGQIANQTLDFSDAGEEDVITARAKLYLTPDFLPGLTGRINFTYIGSDARETRIEESFFPAERVSFQNVLDDEEVDSFIGSGEFQYDITDQLSVTSVTAYIDTQRDFFFDGDGTAAGADIPGEFFSEDEVFSQELRFAYQNGRLTWLAGGYFFDSSGGTQNGSTTFVDSDFALPDPTTLAALAFMTPAPSPAQVAQLGFVRDFIVASIPSFQVDFAGSSTTDIRNFAFFGETTYDVTDKLSLTFGARYDNERVDQTIFTGLNVPPFAPLGDPTADAVVAAAVAAFTTSTTVSADNTFSAFLPKGVISYRWTDDLTTSFSIQRAYRAGGLSFNQFLFSTLDAEDAPQDFLESEGIVNSFDPEFTLNYEFSLRSQWFDRRLTANANVFFIQYNDQQLNLALSPNPLDSITDNVGESRLFGFELEAVANPTDGLELFANFGFTDTEFTEGGGLIGELDLTGFEFAFAPRFTVGFGGRYTHDTGLFINGRFRHTDESFSAVDNSLIGNINDSLITVDMIVGYEQENYSIELFANNIFNEDFLTFNPVDPPAGITPNVSNGSFAAAGSQRVLGVRATAGF
ncbi:MAG: TonB-dependent receptor [Pseudomonadota bacterium]